MLTAMAGGEPLPVRDIGQRGLLLSLSDTEAIGYRQQVLMDCLAQPERSCESSSDLAGGGGSRRRKACG